MASLLEAFKLFRLKTQESTSEFKQVVEVAQQSIWQKHAFMWMTAITTFAIFMLFKSLYIDSYLAMPEVQQDLGPFSIEKNIELDSEWAELMQDHGISSFGLGIFSLCFAFWFCSLVECLSLEETKFKKVFSQNLGLEKGVWLCLFIVLNIVGALLWEMVGLCMGHG